MILKILVVKVQYALTNYPKATGPMQPPAKCVQEPPTYERVSNMQIFDLKYIHEG